MEKNNEDFLDRYLKLERKAYHFYEKHKIEIDDARFKNTSKHILNRVTELLANGKVVWCRQGTIVHLAKPCHTLSCRYKRTIGDVALGCSNCHSYSVTEVSKVNGCYDWATSKHVVGDTGVYLSPD